MIYLLYEKGGKSDAGNYKIASCETQCDGCGLNRVNAAMSETPEAIELNRKIWGSGARLYGRGAKTSNLC